MALFLKQLIQTPSSSPLFFGLEVCEMLSLFNQVKGVLDKVRYLLVHYFFGFDHIEIISETFNFIKLILSDFLHLYISFENLLV
jgi:hypothetical protein